MGSGEADIYKETVKSRMNPFIRMDLNLKESRKYVKQGRTYNSTVENLEILMWFVYEAELENTHRKLGIFAACERELLHTAQEMSKPLDSLGEDIKKLQEINFAGEKDALSETLALTEKTVRNAAYNALWDMRVQIAKKSGKLLREAAAVNKPENLKDACEELDLKGILKELRDAFRDSAGKLGEAARKTGEINSDEVREDGSRKKISDLNRINTGESEGYGRETVLLVQLKYCMETVKEHCKRAADVIEKSLEKYERVENRIAEAEKRKEQKRQESRPSIKRKLEALQGGQAERTGKAAEESRKAAEERRKAARADRVAER